MVVGMRGDGDGWVVGENGTRHWGKHGAAGLLLRAPAPDGGPTVLLQHRALWSHQGGTWALPGGARDSHESSAHAAVREAHEEAGIGLEHLRVRGEMITARVESGWSYTTVFADAEVQLDTIPNGESVELRWVPEDMVDQLPLHPGFAASWPTLRCWTPPMCWARGPTGGGAIEAVPPQPCCPHSPRRCPGPSNYPAAVSDGYRKWKQCWKARREMPDSKTAACR